MEAIFEWLAGHGVGAALLVFVAAVWRQVWPVLNEALVAWANKEDEAWKREILLGLVRAAEQVFGEQPEEAKAAVNLGQRKLEYVLEKANVDYGVMATKDEVEAAVYEAKAKATRLKAVVGTTLETGAAKL